MPYNRIPLATYRLQMNSAFGFEQARAIIDYLDALGISDLYASPLLRARPGSTHGYDVVDANRLNPEIGDDEALGRLSAALRSKKMGMLLDVVPNHMAASSDNRWWFRLLEFGPLSPYVDYFDVDWEPVTTYGTLRNRLLIPILGRPYGVVLESGELQLKRVGGTFEVHYFEHRLPVAPRTYGRILARAEGADLSGVMDVMPPDWDALEPKETGAAAARVKRELAQLTDTDPAARAAVDAAVESFRGTSGDARTFDALDELLEEQWYRLAYWRMASEQINYRRFFDVTDLVGVRVEIPEVFEARHEKIFEMIDAGFVTGLRIDHIDGLFDPVDYLHRLQQRSRRDDNSFYVTVEKILAPDEMLPADFEANGTTGYDFLNLANGVFVDGDGLPRLTSVYEEFIGTSLRYEDVVYRTKHHVIRELFAGEMRELSTALSQIAAKDRNARDFAPADILDALTEVTAALAVYRTYVRDFDVSDVDRRYLETALDTARKRTDGLLDPALFDFLRSVFLFDPLPSDERRDEWLRFVMQWQQFTGRAMAKGVEDTAFYVFNRLLSLNEVGGEPSAESLFDTVEHFHEVAQRTLQRWPTTMNASSTHDTKRSEDVRARLNVLSELPDVWQRHLRKWRRVNHPLKREVSGRLVPDPNEEFMIYQTLIGAWPFEDTGVDDLAARLAGVLEKSLREAKTHSSWLRPNVEYEEGVIGFVCSAIDPANSDFLDDFVPFQRRIAFYGMLNSLSQTVLKITAPGIPDFYQGTELWDLSLVDPDNRRKVDYDARRKLLQSIAELSSDRDSLVQDLQTEWKDGRIKMFVIRELLSLRNELRELFESGSYVPLSASGTADDHLCAFARADAKDSVIVAVPRLSASLVEPGSLPTGSVWSDRLLELPAATADRWKNVFTGETIMAKPAGAGEQSLALDEVFAKFPVAVLRAV